MLVNLTNETTSCCSLYEVYDGRKKKVLQIQYILLKKYGNLVYLMTYKEKRDTELFCVA